MRARAGRVVVLGLIGVLGVETVLFAADTVFPPDLARASLSSPVAPTTAVAPEIPTLAPKLSPLSAFDALRYACCDHTPPCRTKT